MDIDIEGAAGLALVAESVRRLGTDRKIVNEMAKEIRRAVPPIRRAIRANAIETLPHRGGLNVWVSRGRVTANVRRAANNAGITIFDGRNSAGKRSDFVGLNDGTIRHPLFGNREHWYPQQVRANFFTDAITEEGVRAFREAVVVAVDRAAAEVLGG